MDKFIKYLEHFSPILLAYPKWAQGFFILTIILIALSLAVFLILLPSAKRKSETQTTASSSPFIITEPKSGDFVTTRQLSIYGKGAEPTKDNVLKVQLVNVPAGTSHPVQGRLIVNSDKSWRFDYVELEAPGAYDLVFDAIFGTTKSSITLRLNYEPSKLEIAAQHLKLENKSKKKHAMDTIPDVTKAKREVLITSIKQLKQRSNLYDVSKIVPGYFEFTASPSSGTYSNSCVNTINVFKPNYYASVRIAGLQGANVLDFEGRGVWFGLSTITNRYYIYESEENWTTWRELKFKKDEHINTLSIYQEGRTVSVFLNGVFVSTFTKLKKAEPGPISICFKANPKSGGRIHFQKLSIWEF